MSSVLRIGLTLAVSEVNAIIAALLGAVPGHCAEDEVVDSDLPSDVTLPSSNGIQVVTSSSVIAMHSSLLFLPGRYIF
jgi:hypothetical protein